MHFINRNWNYIKLFKESLLMSRNFFIKLNKRSSHGLSILEVYIAACLLNNGDDDNYTILVIFTLVSYVVSIETLYKFV